MNTLAAGPHRFARWVVVAILILCSNLMLERAPLKAVGRGGKRSAVDAFLLQRHTIPVLIVILHDRDLRQTMLHQPAVECFDEQP